MTSVLRKLLLLVAVVAAWSHEADLDAARRSAPRDATRVVPLVPAEERKDMRVAMVTLGRGDGQVLEYLRSQGLWRLRQGFGVLADPGAMQQLVDGVLQAGATLQSDVPERAPDYGFDGERMWSVTFHGVKALEAEDGDVLLSVDLGLSLPGQGGGFVRRRGATDVLAIDADPRALLDRSGPAPPLLDEHLMPAGWPGTGRQIERIVVQHGQDGFVLERTAIAEPALATGPAPPAWMLERPDGRREAPSADHALAYSVFLDLAIWRGVIAPERAQELVGDRFASSLTLVPSSGDPLVFLVGEPMESGDVPVFNQLTRVLHLVGPDVLELLVPRAEALLDAAAPNPYEPWLTRAAQAMLPTPGR